MKSCPFKTCQKGMRCLDCLLSALGRSKPDSRSADADWAEAQQISSLDVAGLRVWDAHNQTGAPICIASDAGGYSIELYVVEGLIIGVVVSTPDGDTATAVGLVAADAVTE